MEGKISIGSIVKAHNKTGTYIGEVTGIKPNHYLVRILAVLKHPMQGDLHHPKEANVPFFHERRALAYGEQTNVMKTMVKLYEGEVPDYKTSLRNAFNQLKEELEKEKDTSLFAQKSLQCLHNLEKEYFNKQN